tara:strand:+ start:407 stop:655 length:249 start_codon:yes stop_codon:yes gene_type:complete
MKKRNLLLLLFIAAFTSTFAQSKPVNQTQPKKVELKSVQPNKQVIQKKSPVNKTVKVQMLNVEKEKATTTPKQKAKSEDSNI